MTSARLLKIFFLILAAPLVLWLISPYGGLGYALVGIGHLLENLTVWVIRSFI